MSNYLKSIELSTRLIPGEGDGGVCDFRGIDHCYGLRIEPVLPLQRLANSLVSNSPHGDVVEASRN